MFSKIQTTQVIKLISVICLLFLFISCDKDGIDPDRLIDPSNVNELSKVLILPAGTDIRNGNPPPPTNSGAAPSVSNNNLTILSSNGSTAPLNFNYSNINGQLGGCYVQVDGADVFFRIPYNSGSGSNGRIQVPLGIPTNVIAGDFCINFCIYDNNNRISNVVSSCVSVLRLGTGAVQVSLSWDNGSDQDLYVTDPEGTTIYYASPDSPTGGKLDRDDTNGYGPENIYWQENAPDGEYQVSVDDYDGVPGGTTFYVTVSGPSNSQNFTGETRNGQKVEVVSFRKRGDRIIF